MGAWASDPICASVGFHVIVSTVDSGVDATKAEVLDGDEHCYAGFPWDGESVSP